jgi:hypothetical protein
MKEGQGGAVIERMKVLSGQYQRYGFRRICIFLGRADTA